MIQTNIPLNALRAFEAAARTGSFTNAARELGVSSAAVSQQVKLLEDHWGKTLFVRQGNRIALTEAGLTAYPPLETSMTALTDVSNMMRHTEHAKRLVLSAPHSVAETWLAPSLASLNFDALGASLHIRIEDDPIDFARDKIDLRIFYGHDLYSEYRVETLFSDALIGVVSPRFAEIYGVDVRTFENNHLIHSDWGPDYSSSPNWSTALPGSRLIDHSAGLRVMASSTALQFVRQGLGAALLPSRMVKDDLAAQNVVALDMAPVPLAHDYLIAYPKRFARNAAIQAIVHALKA